MDAGLAWDETYGIISDVSRLLFLSPDTYKFAVDMKQQHESGSFWQYSSGNISLLNAYMRSQFDNIERYQEYLETKVFLKLGLSSVIMETDNQGIFLPAFTYANSRDMAKIGMLLINKGMWEGERLLPEGWVDFSTKSTTKSDGTYGALLSVNRKTSDFPTAPPTMYYNNGFRGQYGFILPEQDLVILRTAFSDEKVNYERFFSRIMKVF